MGSTLDWRISDERIGYNTATSETGAGYQRGYEGVDRIWCE